MDQKQAFATQSLIITLLCNAVLLAVLYLIGGEALQDRLGAVLGAGLAVTLVLWLLLQALGKRLLGRAAARATTSEATQPTAAPAPPPPKPAPPQLPPATSAVQLLSILQRRGRLIDFLQEDLRQYDDAQIGAAVRSVHEGCREALAEHVVLEPILEAPEGSSVTIEPGFDARAIRLTGNVTGEPPFRGALRHRGWRVQRVDLPALMPGQGPEMVVAAAEVEVGTP